MICHEGNRLELRYILAIDAQVKDESRDDSSSEKNAADALSAWQSHREQCACGYYPVPRIFWRVSQIQQPDGAGHTSPTFGSRKEAFSFARQLIDEGKQAAVIPVDENGAQVAP